MRDAKHICIKEPALRPGLRLIADLIEPQSKVLDLGCGDGRLLEHLQKKKNVKGWGVDISHENVLCCIKRGISVFQGDIEDGLQDFRNDLYDYVIISQTMQEIRSLERLLLEAVRIGEKVVVTFPNFAFVSNRFFLLFKGRSPVTANLPYKWYRSPNVHFFSILDFTSFCKEQNLDIVKKVSYCEGSFFCRILSKVFPNLFAQFNLVVLSHTP